uniref:RNA-dependent RNA polymerase n=1 Tax=Soybean thrips partiti-like virus 2 TaxID=2801005 RepID=A0A7T8IMM1_9VIRU|nr:RNA-dependent RNA polymerase [Soybean thrips partiti-like virus 2]
MVRFIGRDKGFSQWHFDSTESFYCPLEAQQKTKGLVRSRVTLSSIRSDVLSFGSLTSARQPDDPLFRQVVREAATVWSLTEQVQPIHLNDLPRYKLDTDTSSPGLPWRNIGYRTKRQVLDDSEAFKSIRSFWHVIKYGKRKQHPPDCAAFLRAHLVQEGECKVRAVWGYPATIGFQEACFALPLIEGFTNGKFPIAYGYETARGGHLRLLSEYGPKGHFLSSDYRSFDKTIPSWLIRIAFNILALSIDFTKYRDYGIPDADALFKAWKYLVHYFIYTPIRLANGERYRKSGGVASGSYFTQLVDSIVNWIVTVYALRKSGNVVEIIKVLGDDSLVRLQKPLDMEKFEKYSSELGMIINTAKSQTATSLEFIKFLGYYISNGIPKKPVEEFWAALRFPEYPDASFDHYATRAMGLLISTFGQHDEFYDIVSSQLSLGFTVRMSPSLRRYCAALGIESLPEKPPPIIELGFPAFRDRKVRSRSTG